MSRDKACLVSTVAKSESVCSPFTWGDIHSADTQVCPYSSIKTTLPILHLKKHLSFANSVKSERKEFPWAAYDSPLP